MRGILNISLPKEKISAIKEIVRKRGFKSVSEYMLYAVDLEQDMISEDMLMKSWKESKKDYNDWNVNIGLDALKKTLKW